MKDMGKIMGVLKSKHANSLDFSKSKFNYKGIVKLNEVSKGVSRGNQA